MLTDEPLDAAQNVGVVSGAAHIDGLVGNIQPCKSDTSGYPAIPPLWEKSDMSDSDHLSGRRLYDAFMALRPPTLAETEWASQAGVNRGFFGDLKSGKSGNPRRDTIRKLLNYIGKTEADLQPAPPAPPAGGRLPQSNATALAFEGESFDLPQENLPVWGTALGVERMFDGSAVEQTELNTGSQPEYVRRPAILKGKRGAYALHVQGSSMHPALPDGELIVACRDMPLSIGDNVVVYLRDDQEDDGERARAVLVKELIRRSASYVELRQYEPRLDFKVAMVDVLRIDRVLTRREMVS